jgi:serine/threonine protein kinase
LKYCDTCRSAYPNDFSTCPRDQAALRATAELLPGMLVRGKYEIIEKIGAGGMATVYRVKHLAFGEIRALKVVSARLGDDEAFLKRFRTEAVVTRRLQHPNAVRVDDLDVTEDGRPFIVMECVEGRNLREAIRADGAFPVPVAAAIGSQVASALGAAHALGITHRDIKPDNIVLTVGPDGQALAKVLDFGIAKVREGGVDVGAGYTATETGMIVGTPQYVSPEQGMGKRGDQLDGRSDLYSLGVTLYEMITGRLPFESTTPMEMILHHMQTPPPPPQKVRPDLALPPAVGTLLMRALQKEPGRRFKNAEEMVAALDVLAALPATAVSRAAPTARVPAAGSSHSTAIEVEPLVTPAPTRRAPAPARTRPTVVRAQPEEAERSSGTGLIAAAAILAAIVAAVAWRASTRAARVGPVPAPPLAAAAEVPGLPAAQAPVLPAAGHDEGDGPIQNEIQRLLVSSSTLRSQGIIVEVANGIVTLSGSAADPTSAQMAESLAASVSGVRRVFNTVRVSAPAAAAAPSPVAVEAPAAAVASPMAAAAPPGPTAEDRDRDRVRELMDTSKRELEAGNPAAALTACQAALQIDSSHPMARECVRRLESRPGGPPPRRQ